MIILCQGEFKEQMEKSVRLFNLHHREILKKRPTLSTFYTHSVIRGLIFTENLQTEDVNKCIQSRQNRWASRFKSQRDRF